MEVKAEGKTELRSWVEKWVYPWPIRRRQKEMYLSLPRRLTLKRKRKKEDKKIQKILILSLLFLPLNTEQLARIT